MEEECIKIFDNKLCPDYIINKYKQLVGTARKENNTELVRYNRRKRAQRSLLAVGLIAMFVTLLCMVFVTDCFTIGYYDYEINDCNYIARSFKDFCLKRNPNNIEL